MGGDDGRKQWSGVPCFTTDANGDVGNTRVATIKLDILNREMEYNASGQRTKRISADKTYEYIYAGGKLMQMKVGKDVLEFGYDADGKPLTMSLNGTVYYYITNLQGDVVSVENSDLTIASYAYDAWGNMTAISGTYAELNPLRYRGYVYDQELGLYYLGSRYYDPAVGRFINADSADYLGADSSLSSVNLFAYCANNPVNRIDTQGNLSLPNWAKVAIGVGVIGVAAAVTVATGGAAAGTLLAAVHCAASGALVGSVAQGIIGTAAGAVSGAVSHRLSTGSWTGAEQAAINGAATGFMTGTITGAISGAVSSPYCFVAGTTVLTAAGAAAIETIQAGDLVWAWDEETGDVALKPVVETYVNETEELVHVFAGGEEIVATPSHPFYSPVKGWTDAVHLRAGDILVLVNGDYVVVEKIQHEILEAPVAVYNFHVEDYHTYFVASSGVLVHNVCATQNNPGATGQAHHPISRKIQSVANENPNLRGQVTRNGWGTIRANTPADHMGYQKWHRNFDNATKAWLNHHSNASLSEFTNFMNRLYGSEVAKRKFGLVRFK